MNIGIDAKWFFTGPTSGRIVVRALVRELLALYTRHQWTVFVDGATREPFPLKRRGVDVVKVWAGNNMLSNVVFVPRAADRHRVDVTLYQNFSPTWGRSRRVAMVYDVLFQSHPEYYTRTERLYFAPLKYLARRADRLCTISESERQRMVEYGYGQADRIDVVHIGVDDVFRPRWAQDPALLDEVQLSLGLPQQFILFVGRLNARKNVAGLVNALGRMKDRSVHCVIVGAPDWKGDNARDLVRTLGLRKRVLFVGSPSTRDLAAIYSLATVFCFPSFEEGFGLPALEAMASGVPVIVSDRPSLREVCADAVFYVDPEDPDSIAHGLDRVLNESPLQADLRQRGPQRAALFTWRRAAEGVLQCLERTTAY